MISTKASSGIVAIAAQTFVVAPTPLGPVAITEAAHWHPRHEKDPAVVWLRQCLHELAVTIEDDR